MSSSIHHQRHVNIDDTNDELVDTYEGIGEQGVAACASGEWPKSQYFLSHCVTADDGFLAPRRFASDPVVGLNALLCDDPAHLRVLHRAQGAFRAFVDDVSHAVAPDRRDELAKGVYWCPPRAWHVVVAIFQENPALLPDAERERWSAVSPEAVQRLGAELASSLAAAPVLDVGITLHGYRVCADGAMIAVFVEAGQGESEESGERAKSADTVGGDDTNTAGVDGTNTNTVGIDDSNTNAAGIDAANTNAAAGGFLPLRERAKEVGTAALGALTSRPKKLIHATMGRVLKLPENVTPEERAAVSHAAERWAAAFLRGWMPADDTDTTGDDDTVRGNETRVKENNTSTSGHAAEDARKQRQKTAPPKGMKLLPCVGDTLWLSEAVLSTEQQWWMADYTVVARVPLKQPPPRENLYE